MDGADQAHAGYDVSVSRLLPTEHALFLPACRIRVIAVASATRGYPGACTNRSGKIWFLM
jgi:hypothetical protein